MRALTIVTIVSLGLVGSGGTCSDPPPWHDLSGGWVNASWGPERTVVLEGAGTRDVDVALTLSAAVPQDRSPLPVEGAVCVSERDGLGLAGTYLIDAAASTWAGSDYGGERLDLVAHAADGRRIGIAQAFMRNASPAALDNAILTFTSADGLGADTIRFEGFVRRAVDCR